MSQTIVILKVDSDKAAELRQLGEILHQASYTEKSPEPGSATGRLTILHDTDDSLPLILCDSEGTMIRPLLDKEAELIHAHGSVADFTLIHPSASRYGVPLAAPDIPEIRKGFIGDLGYNPQPEVTFQTTDTGDDTPEVYLLGIDLPQEHHEAIEATTATIRELIPGVELEKIAEDAIRTGYDELKKKAETARTKFEGAGGRGIELAEEVDRLEASITLLEETGLTGS